MRSIFAKVATAFVAGAVTACLASAASAQTIPLTIVNQSGYKGKIYVTIYGSTNPSVSNSWYYLSSNGTQTAFTQSGLKNYGFSFSGTSFSLPIPMLQASRVYVSFVAPVMLQVNSTGVPSTPTGWTPGSTNFNTQFDFAEYTWVPNTGQGGGTQIWADTTQVDALGIPMKVTLKGKPNGTTQTLTSGFSSALAGGNIIQALKKAGKPWSNLIIYNKKQPIRVISPVHAMMLTSSSPYYFDDSFWDAYIEQVFTKYAAKGASFGINTGGVFYKGTVSNDQMVLTPNNGEPATIFSVPTSVDLWENGPPLVSGENGATLQTFMQAAFLRSTFLTDSTLSDCPGAGTYYKNAPINVYSKAIHQFAYQDLAYTFPYDDNCSQSSTVSLLQPTSLTLTLLPLDASAD